MTSAQAVRLPSGPVTAALQGQLVERREDVAAIALLHATLRAEALPVRASVDFIAKVKERWT